MGAEILRRELQRLLPARDAFGQRLVNVLEGLLGGVVAGFPPAVKYLARFGAHLGFVAQERVFESGLGIRRIQAHGLGELATSRFVLADLKQRVGEILANLCTLRSRGYRLMKGP